MIELRNFTNADIEQLQKHEDGKPSHADCERLISTWNEKKYNGSDFEMYAVINNGNIVGKASLYARSEHIVSCGIELYAEFRGKGYATAAYPILLALAKQKGFAIAVAQVLANNSASIALHKKAGFEAEDYTYTNRKGNQVYYFIKAL
ncbi:MAG: GNAT family N-acetyltransferase [Clostridiales bacterium]|nr:GNAT family N-acetyltransferase [Clostridiales bacterium]